MKRIFTSEGVRLGHPDLLADYIADSIVTDILSHDREARVAIEVLTSKNAVILSGEITTDVFCDFNKIVADAILDVGYKESSYGIAPDCAVIPLIVQQSPDIFQGVKNNQKDQGAGDQGIQIGFACNETPLFLPMPLYLCQVLLDLLEKSYMDRVDGKVQVSVVYEGRKPISVDSVVMSIQHAPDMELTVLRVLIEEMVMCPFMQVLEFLGMESGVNNFYFNPTGRFVLGGPYADTGVTGRKLAVAGYGGYSRIGGGALCGKDPSKVDRSAAYFTRYVAKNLVASGLCDCCEVHVSYAIGKSEPVAVWIEDFGTAKVSDFELRDIVLSTFDFRPYMMIEKLNLLEVDYRQTVRNHFWNQNLSWEKLNKI